VIAARRPFAAVRSVPRGGDRLAVALAPLATTGPLLIVDDVLTTGASMEATRREFPNHDCVGVVIFARGPTPAWVRSVFTEAATDRCALLPATRPAGG